MPNKSLAARMALFARIALLALATASVAAPAYSLGGFVQTKHGCLKTTFGCVPLSRKEKRPGGDGTPPPGETRISVEEPPSVEPDDDE